MLAIFGGSILGAFLGILGTVIIISFEKHGLRFILHLGWCVICLMMIVGFVLSTVLVPIGVAVKQTNNKIKLWLIN